MGWEQRGNHQYYYRKRRIGRLVSSEYVGNSLAAQLFSDMDQEEREEVISTRMSWIKEKQGIRSLDSEFDHLNEMVAYFVKAMLLTSGYHPHKGQWRKKRNA